MGLDSGSERTSCARAIGFGWLVLSQGCLGPQAAGRNSGSTSSLLTAVIEVTELSN